MDDQADLTEAGERKPPGSSDPRARNEKSSPSPAAKRLAQELGKAANLGEARVILRRRIKSLWPAIELYFATVDPVRPRFLMLRPDGTRVPKPSRHFALDDFLTTPGRSHVYAERVVRDLEVLGELAANATHDGLLTYSLAVPVYRGELLRAAIVIFADKAFDWSEEDIERLAEFGGIFLHTCDVAVRAGTQRIKRAEAPPTADETPMVEDPAVWRDLLAIHSAAGRVITALLQPLDVVEASCHELAPFFEGFHFTIAVHYPESRLLVIHALGHEPKRVPCDETIEGYFLYRTDEDVLAIEEYSFWSAPEPLCLDDAQENDYQSGLFAVARIQGTLVGVIGLRAREPVKWQAREIELLRTAARGFGVAYYHAMVCDNLTYSCREAHRKIEGLRREAESWQRRMRHIQAATNIARSLPACDQIPDLLERLLRVLAEQWPDRRLTVQRYVPEANGFETFPAAGQAGEAVRPARHCIQNLFLNSIPVTHIVCDSPQEIASYADVDPDLVSECTNEGFRSFCTVPIFAHSRLWGAISMQSQDAGGCGLQAELLSQIGHAVTRPIEMVEQHARALRDRDSTECRRQFWQMLEEAPVPMLLVDSETGTILKGNRLAVEILSVTAEQLHGVSLDSLGARSSDQVEIRRLHEQAGKMVIARSECVSLSGPGGVAVEGTLAAASVPCGGSPAMVVMLQKPTAAAFG